MYETEANRKVEALPQHLAHIAALTGELRGKILRRSVLPWSEHCTECAWPTCYSTCTLYSPRPDGRCRRFVDGMVRVPCPAAVNGYLLKIRFKPWGKLWTPGNLRLHEASRAAAIEKRDYRIGSVLYQLPVPRPIRTFATAKRYGLKKRMAASRRDRGANPTAFVLECFNPATTTVPLSFTIRPGGAPDAAPFQELIELAPGFQRVRIPFDRIRGVTPLDGPFHLELVPNHDSGEVTLYFGLMDFIQETPAAAPTAKVKCVVWDLDNTLWDGVLVEQGADRIALRPGVVTIVEALDRRGILQSIASKNNPDEALSVLKRLRVDEYFLAPQISWGPKSQAVHLIAEALNIGVDSILFVDDSEFELREVQSACPTARTLNARDCAAILQMKECRTPPTAEGGQRRKMYQVELVRREAAGSFKDDYLAFLRDCRIELRIEPLTEQNLDRVHELTQRTNQMNFSGNRYTRDVLTGIMRTPDLESYVISCDDRFGSYGIVGFGIVDRREPRLTDLMFSCRVQAKRVEHAFLGYLLRKYSAEGAGQFYANYRKTPRNQQSGRVFADLGMQDVATADGLTSLVAAPALPSDDGLVTVVAPEGALRGCGR